MKAAIYNPYLDTLGGGERYTIEFCRVLSEIGYNVDIEWKNGEILKKISNRFGVKVPQNIKVVEDIKKGKDYDICFWVSDGSIPTLNARKNILHFQVPFKNVNGSSLLNKMKLFRINDVICNSRFTKSVIDKEYGVDSIVLYPPIETRLFNPKRKENIILYVGRFSSLLQSKGQDVLVNTFKKLYDFKSSKDYGNKSWKLVLAGGVEVGSSELLYKLKLMVDNYPIEIVESPKFKELQALYGKAKIFWSASGFGVDQNKNPEKVEHFGMTVVEAMSAGVVPVITSNGGHLEIVSSGKNGYLWHNEQDLLDLTTKLINEKGLLSKLSKSAKISSQNFGKEVFKKNIEEIL
ncbi:MAG: glycosyltransferase family 4 protein [bacterium]|nr:MAG: glycosyltransferase family 4 protein [bacterium]